MYSVYNDSVSNFFLGRLCLLNDNFIKEIACFLIKKNNNISVFLKKGYFYISNFLRNSIYFYLNQALDFTIVDRLEMSIKKDKRFEFNYLFISTIFNYRFFLRGFVSSFESLNSLSFFFSSLL